MKIMLIRTYEEADFPYVQQLWNDAVAAGEVVYKPISAETFREKFLGNANYWPELSLVAETEGKVVGFVNGVMKKVFLPKQNAENTPGYLTCIFVARANRRQGVGSALMEALEQRMRVHGKKNVMCHGDNPINLDWTIPGTPGHDHNNAPGMDEACAGYPFLQARGYVPRYHEVAMYLNLQDYRAPEDLAQKRQKLADEGIYTGFYDVAWNYEYNGIFDRVGSEYWRKVFQDEIASPHPRPILVAAHDGAICGFTGPVDKQPSGRGWFTGICTDPLFEKRGIASVLFNLLMQAFIAEGAAFSTLFTGKEAHARRVYERAGLRAARYFAIMEKHLD